MPTSSLPSRILATAFSLLFLAGCNLPTPQNKDEKAQSVGNANFSLQAMADKSKALETLVQGNFDLPASKTFNFVACVKDIAYDKSIIGHDFLVQETNTRVTSDKSGCITWSETINFNFMATPRYVRLERIIKGLGLFKGTQRASFAVNPWTDSASVLNPDDGNEIPGLENNAANSDIVLQGTGGTASRPLWIEDGRVFISEKQLNNEGIVLNIELRPNPSLLMAKTNGDTYLRPLTAGTFDAQMKMIHVYTDSSNKEVRRVLGESAKQRVSMTSGTLAVKSDIKLPAIPTRGQLMLALMLEPVAAPQIRPFEGVYMLAEYDQIKGTLLLKVNTAVLQTENFKIADFLTPELATIATKKDGDTWSVDQDMYQRPKIEVAPLEFRYIGTGAETTNTREILFNVKACLRHGLDQKSIRAQTFKIKKIHGNEVLSLTTDNNSCLYWDERVTYNYFSCQYYQRGSVQITSEALGMTESINVLINPWDFPSNPAAARDVRYINGGEQLAQSCQERPRTQIFMDTYFLNALSYEYSVDNYLNLTLHKKMHLKLDPKLLVLSSVSQGRDEHQKMRDGAYLLRLAVVKNRDYDQNRNTFVTAVDKLVSVINGQINTEVVFKTQDFKALGNRNNLLVEIYPVDEKKIKVQAEGQISLVDATKPLTSAIDLTSPLETPTFVGPIILNMDDPARSLRLLDSAGLNQFLVGGQGQNTQNAKNVIEAVVAQGQQSLAASAQDFFKRANRSEFTKENNLDLIDLKTADTQKPLLKSINATTSLRNELMVTKADLQSVITNGTLSSAVAKKLCTFWAADYFRKMYESKGGAMGHSASAFGYDCMAQVEKDPSKFFVLEKHMLIKEVGGGRLANGYNHVLNIGTNFSMGTAHSTYFTKSHSVAFKAGISKKFLDIFSFGVDYAHTLSWAESTGNSATNSVNVGANTTLLVQQNQMKIRVNKHEQCAIIRLNPVLFIPNSNFFFTYDYLGHFNQNLTETELTTAATRGLMVCEGEIKTNAQEITENYYTIAQETNSTQMQDNGDARNRNFFLTIRSSYDYKRFVLGVRGQINMPTSAQANDDGQDQTMAQFQESLKLFAPSYPSMFRIK